MAEVGSAFLTIVPSAKGIGSKLSAQVGPDLDAAGKAGGTRFGAGFKTALLAGVAVAGAAASKFISDSIAEARESQKVGAQTAAVIKSTGGAANVTAAQIGTLSNAISKKVGIDDEAIQSSANMLLTFTNVRNEAGKGNDVFNQATKTITDMSAALGQDGKSSAMQLGKALNDPIKGITALRRVGVAFTDEQKKQITTMVKAGNTVGAQKIILGELSKEFGGSAAAQATAGDKMGVAWKNLQESIGTKLLPVLDRLQAGLTVVFNFIGSHQSVMIAIAAIIGVVLVAALVAAAAAAWSFTIALLANPVVWIVIAIIALVAAIVLLVKNWDVVKKKTAQVWAAIKSAIASAWASIVSTVQTKGAAVVQWFQQLPGKILGLLAKAGTWLLKVGENIINGLVKGIGNGFKWVKAKIVELGGNVLGWAKSILHIGSPSKLMADEVGKWIPAGIALGIDQNASTVHSSLASLTADMTASARTGAGISISGATASRTPAGPILVEVANVNDFDARSAAITNGALDREAFYDYVSA